MLLGPVRTHLTTWAGNTDCIAKINSRGEMGSSQAQCLHHRRGPNIERNWYGNLWESHHYKLLGTND